MKKINLYYVITFLWYSVADKSRLWGGGVWEGDWLRTYRKDSDKVSPQVGCPSECLFKLQIHTAHSYIPLLTKFVFPKDKNFQETVTYSQEFASLMI